MNLQSMIIKSRYGDKNFKIFVVVSFLVVALMIDTLIGAIPDFLQDRIVSGSGITLFILIAVSYMSGQYFILKFIKEKTKDIRANSPQLNTTHRIVTVVQYVLVAILVSVIMEILIIKQYHLVNLIAATLISYGLNVALLLLFATRLLRWFRSNKNSIVILLYSICAIVLGFTAILAVVADFNNLIIKEGLILPESPITFPSFDPGTLSFASI